MKCDCCGAEFEPGEIVDGVPNGISFALKDWTKITMCIDCLIALGQMTDKERNDFFEFFKAAKGEGKA